MGTFDVIVVGAGHAGCEAAAAAARLGCRVAVVTLRADHVGRLSCNPAIGGLAKGHLVRELDALGGLMARVADATCLQFRRLNTRKGLAVQSSRAQVDIDAYPRVMRAALDRIDGLSLVEGEVAALDVRSGRVRGVALADGRRLEAPAVVLTTGTFLAGVLHMGAEQERGGRIGDRAAHRLSDALRDLGLRLGRLKTGTVPRLDGRTVDWARLPEQTETVPDGRFSFGEPQPRGPEVRCHLAWTNPGVHDLIRANLHRSPLYTGAIQERGPRYCPSIEDKVVRFADKERHLLFAEPEGRSTPRVYLSGLSTSLPADVQEQVVHAIVGLERAQIMQHGYAVAYDFADPTDLGHDLQHRAVPGLYLAGQVNGTSGYEEAAVQGFVAGVSAATGSVFHVERSAGYIGVLVDDLVTRGIGGEPYRMFPSRAEHRLLLREDNADRRLMPRGRALGLVDDATWAAFERREEQRVAAEGALDVAVHPTASVRAALEGRGLGGLKKPSTAREVLRRPAATWGDLVALFGLPEVPVAVAEQVEIDTKYAGYIARAQQRAEAAGRMSSVRLPEAVDWMSLEALSWEVRERLQASRPETLGALSRVPGVTPAAVGVVAMWLRSGRA